MIGYNDPSDQCCSEGSVLTESQKKPIISMIEEIDRTTRLTKDKLNSLSLKLAYVSTPKLEASDKPKDTLPPANSLLHILSNHLTELMEINRNLDDIRNNLAI